MQEQIADIRLFHMITSCPNIYRTIHSDNLLHQQFLQLDDCLTHGSLSLLNQKTPQKNNHFAPYHYTNFQKSTLNRLLVLFLTPNIYFTSMNINLQLLIHI